MNPSPNDPHVTINECSRNEPVVSAGYRPRVITGPVAVVLNGPSGAGKSTIASALQRELDDVWFHLAVDHFLERLPLAERQSQLAVELPQILQGIHGAMGAIVKAGNRVIIDHVLALPGSAADLRAALGRTTTLWVGLTCDLAVLEQRERERDREPGTARGQVEAVHRDIDYDLTIDTTAADVGACAALVRDELLARSRAGD
jgi:chloramphenicol 3-O phosphotransferase